MTGEEEISGISTDHAPGWSLEDDDEDDLLEAPTLADVSIATGDDSLLPPPDLPPLIALSDPDSVTSEIKPGSVFDVISPVRILPASTAPDSSATSQSTIKSKISGIASSDSSSSSASSNASSSSSSNNLGQNEITMEVDDDVDPLDAFMSTLYEPTSENGTSEVATQKELSAVSFTSVASVASLRKGVSAGPTKLATSDRKPVDTMDVSNIAESSVGQSVRAQTDSTKVAGTDDSLASRGPYVGPYVGKSPPSTVPPIRSISDSSADSTDFDGDYTEVESEEDLIFGSSTSAPTSNFVTLEQIMSGQFSGGMEQSGRRRGLSGVLSLARSDGRSGWESDSTVAETEEEREAREVMGKEVVIINAICCWMLLLLLLLLCVCDFTYGVLRTLAQCA